MFFKLVIFLISLLISTSFGAGDEDLSFVYNGFRSAANNLSLDGLAKFTSNGLLHLTNHTQQQTGHAFYTNPVTFKNSSTNGTVFSFSTTFVFGILSQFPTLAGHEPSARPTMRQVVQYLERNVQLPELSGLGLSISGLTFEDREGFTDIAMSYSSSIDKSLTRASSVAESLLSDGR
ncbi:hypothetical protein Q3G72_033377 [Acer saccharum]|nr:hypothetical protein Q3G72_033377 [Acer saccharum]